MQLRKKALELGQAIRESDQFRELQRAGDNLKEDSDAREIVKSMQEARRELESMQKSGVQPNRDQVNHINNLQEQMQSNLTVRVFMKAQEEFGEVLEQVNAAISEGISGGEEKK